MGEGAATDPAPEAPLLDLRGLRCPLPALRAAKRLAGMRPGERLQVLADDPLAPLDIALLCRAEGHALLNEDRLEGAARFLIARAPRPSLAP